MSVASWPSIFVPAMMDGVVVVTGATNLISTNSFVKQQMHFEMSSAHGGHVRLGLSVSVCLLLQLSLNMI